MRARSTSELMPKSIAICLPCNRRVKTHMEVGWNCSNFKRFVYCLAHRVGSYLQANSVFKRVLFLNC